MATLIIFILILGLLVVVHEWGHYITAKKSGMKVYEFGFGFPPRAIGFYRDPETKKIVWVRGGKKGDLKNTVGGGDRGNTLEERDPSTPSTEVEVAQDKENEFPATVWSINWLPLGGFVKIKGENGEKREENDSFMAKKPGQRILVLVAGVSMNVVLAGVLLAGGFMIGLPTDFSMGIDESAIVVQEPSVMIQMVEKNSPAEIAGIKYGDRILSANGAEILSTKDLSDFVLSHSEENIDLVVIRGEEELIFSLTPAVIKNENQPRLGIMMAEAGVIRYPWYTAIYKGFVVAGFGLVNIFIAFYYLLKNLLVGQGLVFDVAGPVGIAVLVGDSARLGLAHLINITAMLSLSLAAINILPIPALDGGRILFILIEKIFRRPVPMKYEQIAHTLGFLLLMALIVVVTWRDVVGLIK